jgi:DNA-binding beta-propeller fold protein YncE
LLTTITTPADNKPGDLNSPYGIAIDSARNLMYVSETKGNRVDVFDLTNPLAPAWDGSFGATGTGNGQFREPQGLAVDNSGNVYVTDLLNERVEVFNP